MTSRWIGLSCGALLAALGCQDAQAAGRGPAGWQPPAASVRPAPHGARLAHGNPHRRGATRWVWGGYPATWLWPDGSGQSVTIVAPPPVRRPAIDRRSFENLQARAGIRNAPTPEPSLYRLEGPRSNPGVRVIRVAGADEGAPQRSRFAHAETGALMLTVPGR